MAASSSGPSVTRRIRWSRDTPAVKSSAGPGHLRQPDRSGRWMPARDEAPSLA